MKVVVNLPTCAGVCYRPSLYQLICGPSGPMEHPITSGTPGGLVSGGGDPSSRCRTGTRGQ